MGLITSYTGTIPHRTDYRENPIHNDVHVPEFKAISHQMIQEEVPDMIKETIMEILPAIIDGMLYDINTILTISMADGEEL